MDFEAKNAYPLYGFVSFGNSGDVVTDTINVRCQCKQWGCSFNE